MAQPANGSDPVRTGTPRRTSGRCSTRGGGLPTRYRVAGQSHPYRMELALPPWVLDGVPALRRWLFSCGCSLRLEGLRALVVVQRQWRWSCTPLPQPSSGDRGTGLTRSAGLSRSEVDCAHHQYRGGLLRLTATPAPAVRPSRALPPETRASRRQGPEAHQ